MSTIDRENVGYEIEAFTEIPVDMVVPNPANPRPTFHLDDDDPDLMALADAISTEKQHNPAAVYEIMGHYKLKDRPGHFMLLQGERRWRACKLAGVEMLRVNVHRTPRSLAEEMELLSVEDAHKLPWQPFFEMLHAKRLADVYKMSVRSPEIAAKTGLNMEQLKIAEKLFSLAPEVQEMVAEYEQEMHAQRVAGKRKKGGRISGQGVRVMEFTPAKAALVYDIFLALRANMTTTVKDLSDDELQKRIAAWSTNGANLDDLNGLLQGLRQCGENPPPGMVAKIHNLIKNPDSGVSQVMRTMGNNHIAKLVNLSTRMEKIGRDAGVLARRGDHFGHDAAMLESVRARLIAATRELDRLERSVSDRIRTIERRG